MEQAVPEYLNRLARIQCGVVSARQARQAGITKDAVRQRLRTGRWRQLHHGVYAVFSGEPTRLAILWGVVLRPGGGALLSHFTAAELCGLIDEPTALVHVTIPESRRITPIHGVVIHVGSRTETAAHAMLLPPRTRIEETVLDLTQLSRDSEHACAWIACALGRRLTTQGKLRDALNARKRVSYRCELAEMLSSDMAGVHSGLEYRYVRWAEMPHGLPAGRRQVRIRSGGRTLYRDVAYDDFQLVVELDGAAAHPAETRWQDIRRDNAAAADGTMTLRYGLDDLRRPGCFVADQVYRALSRSGKPVPGHPCSPACPVGRHIVASRRQSGAI
jgi:very-short-patch-repair endonuclease